MFAMWPQRRAVRPIIHRGRIAALAAERVYYASHIEVLEPDHPERRFVAALCLYSHPSTPENRAAPSTTKRRLSASCAPDAGLAVSP
jgi:hypothetical protein